MDDGDNSFMNAAQEKYAQEKYAPTIILISTYYLNFDKTSMQPHRAQQRNGSHNASVTRCALLLVTLHKARVTLALWNSFFTAVYVVACLFVALLTSTWKFVDL